MQRRRRRKAKANSKARANKASGGDGFKPNGKNPISSAVTVQYSLTGGYPDRSRVRLKYVTNILYNTAVGQTQVFSGNGLYDPDVTGTGGQPYNYDEWAAAYSRYYCRGSTIKVTVLNLGSSVTTASFVFLCVPRHTTTSVATTGYLDAIAAPYAKYIALGSGAAVSGSNGRVLVHTMSSQKMFGQKFDAYTAINEQVISSQPVHQWYWHLDTHALDDSAFQGARGLVEITYDVDFFDRTELTLDSKQQRLRKLREYRILYLKAKAKGQAIELVGLDEAKTTVLQVDASKLVPESKSTAPKEEKKGAPATPTKSLSLSTADVSDDDDTVAVTLMKLAKLKGK